MENLINKLASLKTIIFKGANCASKVTSVLVKADIYAYGMFLGKNHQLNC